MVETPSLYTFLDSVAQTSKGKNCL